MQWPVFSRYLKKCGEIARRDAISYILQDLSRSSKISRDLAREA
jgi:hypothetical protein